MTAEFEVAVGGKGSKSTLFIGHNSDVERAASEVEDQEFVVFLKILWRFRGVRISFHCVGKGGRSGFVDDVHYGEAREKTCVLSG